MATARARGAAVTRIQAQQSITELDRAINVIQRSPVIQDAMQMGLMVVDVATLGQMAGARMLTTSVVKEFLASRGTHVTEAQASRIAENFYREAPASEAVQKPIQTAGSPQNVSSVVSQK
ncbi:hypothetical protein [Xylophilus ampelinus]|uniref:hypothetical protein n=1 Tax=Xylophilus ampelinus TaxID=54067 RepID=UPI00216AB604|nr:hypothetical protein [Xylophilus ampelinus]MCS4511943.1 hypothetical protein [Xylophilus ampelinus]